MAVDTTQVSQSTVDASKHAYDATYKAVFDKTNDARLSAEMAGSAMHEYFSGPGVLTSLIGLGISLAASFAAVATDKVTQAKAAGQPGIHDLIAATLSDALLIDIKSSDIPIGQGASGQAAANAALGSKFIEAMKAFMGSGGTVTGDTAEKGAAAIAGLGMQLSVNTGFLAILGGCVPQLHLDELKEIGEMLEKSLGLGRLMQRCLRPYVQQLVQKPLARKLAAQYRQDILGTGELVRAIFRGGPLAQTAKNLLAQHGLPDDQIAELTEQLRPHLNESELDTLVFQGEMTQPEAVAHIGNAGVPANIAQLRFRAITLQRLARLQEAGAGEVLSLIRDGKLPQSAMGEAMDTFDIPQLERDLWNKRAAVYATVRRRELGKGDIFFLYEHGQVTLDDVTQWATQEGYDPADILNIQLEAIVKAGGISNKTPDQIAAATKHLHNQHAAFVQDVFEGAYGRPASPAELAGWTLLLDTKQRTRADVKTEAKLNPTPPAQ